MDTGTHSRFGRLLRNRTAVAAAGAVGFLIGAGGFVAAQQGADDLPPDSTDVETTVVDSAVDTTDATPTSVDVSIPAAAGTTPDSTDVTVPATADTTPDSTDVTVPATADTTPDSTDVTEPTDDSMTSIPGDDGSATSTTIDGDDDDATSTTIDDDDDDDDDATSTTIDDDDDDDDDATSTTIDDDDDEATSTSVPASLPAPFSKTYRSSGGSIGVSWSGTALSLDSISPSAGFAAEIEDNSWNKIRVDFEHDDDDARIEVRLHEGRIRVRID